MPPAVPGLALRERQELEHRRPASQGLGHLGQKEQVLRAGEEILAAFLAPGIQTLPEEGEELRSVLDFVENDRGRMQLKKARGSAATDARTSGGSRLT